MIQRSLVEPGDFEIDAKELKDGWQITTNDLQLLVFEGSEWKFSWRRGTEWTEECARHEIHRLLVSKKLVGTPKIP
jgi:hypothetical protein